MAETQQFSKRFGGGAVVTITDLHGRMQSQHKLYVDPVQTADSRSWYTAHHMFVRQ